VYVIAVKLMLEPVLNFQIARVLVERNELTRHFASEHKPAAGCQHTSRTWQIGQWNPPFLLTS
jgi:hypothetical protein